MPIDQIALLLLSFGFTALGWFAKQMWEAVKELRTDLAKLRVEIAKEYVSYDRMDSVLEPIMDALNEIKASLKDKVDKS